MDSKFSMRRGLSVVHPFEWRQLLRLLNAEPLRQSQYEALVQEHDKLFSLFRLQKLPARLQQLGIADQNAAEKQIVTSRLRELIDEWLGTGIDKDGSEWPTRRDVFRTGEGLEVLESLAKQGGLLELVLVREASRLEVTVPAVARERDIWASSARILDFVRTGLNHAERLFIRAILSDENAQLCKCPYSLCGKYFQAASRRSKYRRGVFCCIEHSHGAAAVRAVGEKRSWVQTELVRKAAERLLQLGIADASWQDDQRRKIALAANVRQYVQNSREPRLIAYFQCVTIQKGWITRHRHEIERQRVVLSRLGIR